MKFANLIPLHVRDARARRACARRWIGGLAVYLLMLAATCAGVRAALATGARDLSQDIAATTSRAERLEQEINAARRQLAEIQASRAAADAIADQPNWSHFLAILTDAMEEDVVLRGLTLAPLNAPAGNAGAGAASGAGIVDRFAVSMKAVARGQTSVASFVLRLQQLCIFDEVRLVRSGREGNLDAAAVAFEVECTISR